MNKMTTSYEVLNCKYPIKTRILEGLAKFLGLSCFVLGGFQIIESLIYSTALQGGALLAPFSLLFLMYGFFTQFPDLRISQNGIDVKILWSWRKLEWEKLESKMVARYFLVLSSIQLPRIYRLYGQYAWIGRRVVFVNRSISNFDVVASTLIHKKQNIAKERNS
jgi:hypothetical protein